MPKLVEQTTIPYREGVSRDRIQIVLDAIGAEDPDRARRARAVIDWVTAGEGIEMIDLASVQTFAWYTLPVKWSDSEEENEATLAAAADLFERLDMPRYAAVFRSSETTAILAANSQSRSAGRRAFRSALKASGVDPPDLDDFAWGGVMGIEEATARQQAERALEEAMTAGEFEPGKAGWKAVAREVTTRVLDSPHPDLPGNSRRTAILTERLGTWVSSAQGHSPDLHSLRSQFVKQLFEPVPVPEDAAERIAPVTWLLAHALEGVRLTQAGYLPTALVRETCEHFGWDRGWDDRTPRNESESVQLRELHGLVRRLGAVRRRGADLRTTQVGKGMLGDTEVAWRRLAAGLSGGPWPTAVAEAYTLLLLDGVVIDEEIEARATLQMAGMGWRTDGHPPETGFVSSTWFETWRPLAALGGVSRAGDWRLREIVLTPFGRATLLEQVRIHATGPRSTPW